MGKRPIMTKWGEALVILLAALMLAACGGGGGSGGSGEEAGLVEGTSGSWSFSCLMFKYTVQDNQVTVDLYLERFLMDRRVLTAQDNRWNMFYMYNNNVMKCDLYYLTGTSTRPPQLHIDNLEATCHDEQLRFTGAIATW